MIHAVRLLAFSAIISLACLSCKPEGVSPVHQGPLTATPTINGSFNYAAGTGTATVNVPSGMLVKQLTCSAASGAAGAVTIAGGASVTVPAGLAFTEDFAGTRSTIVGPVAIVFTTVGAYYVSWSN